MDAPNAVPSIPAFGNAHSANQTLQASPAASKRLWMVYGSSSFEATRQAYGQLANKIDQQAIMLAYIDNFWTLGVTIMVMIPFVFLMKRGKPGSTAAMH